MAFIPELAMLGTVLLLGCISPGPDFVAVTSHALADRRSGVKIACGIATAITIWAALSVAGLAFVLSRVAFVYEAVRLAGAAFLVYLGIKLLWSARHGATDGPPRLAAATTQGSFRRGFVLGLFNPKSAVFFSSLFATLLPADAPVWVFAATIALAAVTAFGWFLAVAFLFSVGRIQSLYRRARRVIDATMGVVLAALGLRLAFER
ncbi:LysE family translocator [Salinisphaera sp. Q1T1-3]|uniref:LysE family translocator n=1 Tax=Salinisphaera sp. Q1T1-3 TaxID=2321229 RepID=UPI000E719809|nr:LysE family translocator [Salinisphaera sp. Q1T1-3]RJS91857.1 LysE family translocator [Salinisphaera sp. Q1T1-3]